MKCKGQKKIKALFFVLLFALIFSQSVSSAHALSIAAHVPEKYTVVEAGDRFYFEIDIKYPENPRRKDLRLRYEITRDGELIAQAKVLKAVETQASFIDFIIIPENAKKGLYIINILISDYEALDEEVSASFNVVGGKAAQLTLYFFILLGVILFVGLLVIIQILLTRRKKVNI